MDLVIYGHVALALEYEYSCQRRRLHRVPLYVPPFWVCSLVGAWVIVCALLCYMLPVLVGVERLRVLRGVAAVTLA